jgi:small subunit ribosomal protein S10e
LRFAQRRHVPPSPLYTRFVAGSFLSSVLPLPLKPASIHHVHVKEEPFGYLRHAVSWWVAATGAIEPPRQRAPTALYPSPLRSVAYPDGVIVVAKDPSLEKHLALDIPNIHVLDALKSLMNRAHVRETFSWCVRRHWWLTYCGPWCLSHCTAPPHLLNCRQFHYYYLTDSGIEYLRQYLHLPAETVPNTHKKPARPAGAREERPLGGERRPGFGRGERGGFEKEGGYRRAAPAQEA